MKKWYEGVYRRHLADMHINDTDERFLCFLNADEYYENLVKAKIESPMIYLQSHVGLCNYPTESAKTHRRFQHGENEIKRLISKCKANGMKVVGYYSLIFNNVAAEAHPEWEMRYFDGSTWRDKGQRYGLCCPNNKDYREFVKVQINELAREFNNLDGIFFDMPYWEVACYCDACKSRFKSDTGADIPEKQDFSDEKWLEFVKARQDYMVDFVCFVREYTNKVMPGVTVEFNYAAVIGCDWLGGSTEGINAECEFTGGDLYGDLYSHSFACKYYYAVTKNQPFEYMTCRCDRTLREHTITKPQNTLEHEILLTTAHHGASLIIDAIDPVGTLDGRVYDRIGKAFSRQIPYESYMNIGKLYSEVAVYFDSKTMYSTDGTDKYNRTCAIGAIRNLIEAHIPCSVIANGAMNDLERYKVIVAPALQTFDNSEPLKLIDYVKNGGVLYLSGASDERLIKEFFDARVEGKTYDDTPYTGVQLGARAYISPKDDAEEIFGEFNDKYPLPLTYALPKVKGAKAADVLATVTLAYASPDDNTRFASIHSCPPWQKTDYPALLTVNYGKGRVIWCIAELEYDHRRAFVDAFNRIISSQLDKKYSFDAGRAIEAVVFESESSTLISLCDLMHDEAKINAPAKFCAKCGVAPRELMRIGTKEKIPFEFDAEASTMSATLEVADFEMYEIRF